MAQDGTPAPGMQAQAAVGIVNLTSIKTSRGIARTPCCGKEWRVAEDHGPVRYSIINEAIMCHACGHPYVVAPGWGQIDMFAGAVPQRHS
ncbi:MAG: hypothetical protein ACM31O_03665 [Bacteroidota bacterium]